MKSFYEKIQGDYEGTIARLMTEERIKKYVLRFADTDDYQNMIIELEKENWPDAFRFVHNLKGVSLNLGFSTLAQSSSDFCEEIRNGAPNKDIKPFVEKITKDYNEIVKAIKEIM